MSKPIIKPDQAITVCTGAGAKRVRLQAGERQPPTLRTSKPQHQAQPEKQARAQGATS